MEKTRHVVCLITNSNKPSSSSTKRDKKGGASAGHSQSLYESECREVYVDSKPPQDYYPSTSIDLSSSKSRQKLVANGRTTTYGPITKFSYTNPEGVTEISETPSKSTKIARSKNYVKNHSEYSRSNSSTSENRSAKAPGAMRTYNEGNTHSHREDFEINQHSASKGSYTQLSNEHTPQHTVFANSKSTYSSRLEESRIDAASFDSKDDVFLPNNTARTDNLVNKRDKGGHITSKSESDRSHLRPVSANLQHNHNYVLFSQCTYEEREELRRQNRVNSTESHQSVNDTQSWSSSQLQKSQLRTQSDEAKIQQDDNRKSVTFDKSFTYEFVNDKKPADISPKKEKGISSLKRSFNKGLNKLNITAKKDKRPSQQTDIPTSDSSVTYRRSRTDSDRISVNSSDSAISDLSSKFSNFKQNIEKRYSSGSSIEPTLTDFSFDNSEFQGNIIFQSGETSSLNSFASSDSLSTGNKIKSSGHIDEKSIFRRPFKAIRRYAGKTNRSKSDLDLEIFHGKKSEDIARSYDDILSENNFPTQDEYSNNATCTSLQNTPKIVIEEQSDCHAQNLLQVKASPAIAVMSKSTSLNVDSVQRSSSFDDRGLLHRRSRVRYDGNVVSKIKQYETLEDQKFPVIDIVPHQWKESYYARQQRLMALESVENIETCTASRDDRVSGSSKFYCESSSQVASFPDEGDYFVRNIVEDTNELQKTSSYTRRCEAANAGGSTGSKYLGGRHVAAGDGMQRSSSIRKSVSTSNIAQDGQYQQQGEDKKGLKQRVSNRLSSYNSTDELYARCKSTVQNITDRKFLRKRSDLLQEGIDNDNDYSGPPKPPRLFQTDKDRKSYEYPDSPLVNEEYRKFSIVDSDCEYFNSTSNLNETSEGGYQIEQKTSRVTSIDNTSNNEISSGSVEHGNNYIEYTSVNQLNNQMHNDQGNRKDEVRKYATAGYYRANERRPDYSRNSCVVNEVNEVNRVSDQTVTQSSVVLNRNKEDFACNAPSSTSSMTETEVAQYYSVSTVVNRTNQPNVAEVSADLSEHIYESIDDMSSVSRSDNINKPLYSEYALNSEDHVDYRQSHTSVVSVELNEPLANNSNRALRSQSVKSSFPMLKESETQTDDIIIDELNYHSELQPSDIKENTIALESLKNVAISNAISEDATGRSVQSDDLNNSETRFYSARTTNCANITYKLPSSIAEEPEVEALEESIVTSSSNANEWSPQIIQEVNQTQSECINSESTAALPSASIDVSFSKNINSGSSDNVFNFEIQQDSKMINERDITYSSSTNISELKLDRNRSRSVDEYEKPKRIPRLGSTGALSSIDSRTPSLATHFAQLTVEARKEAADFIVNSDQRLLDTFFERLMVENDPNYSSKIKEKQDVVLKSKLTKCDKEDTPSSTASTNSMEACSKEITSSEKSSLFLSSKTALEERHQTTSATTKTVTFSTSDESKYSTGERITHSNTPLSQIESSSVEILEEKCTSDVFLNDREARDIFEKQYNNKMFPQAKSTIEYSKKELRNSSTCAVGTDHNSFVPIHESVTHQSSLQSPTAVQCSTLNSRVEETTISNEARIDKASEQIKTPNTKAETEIVNLHSLSSASNQVPFSVYNNTSANELISNISTAQQKVNEKETASVLKSVIVNTDTMSDIEYRKNLYIKSLDRDASFPTKQEATPPPPVAWKTLVYTRTDEIKSAIIVTDATATSRRSSQSSEATKSMEFSFDSTCDGKLKTVGSEMSQLTSHVFESSNSANIPEHSHSSMYFSSETVSKSPTDTVYYADTTEDTKDTTKSVSTEQHSLFNSSVNEREHKQNARHNEADEPVDFIAPWRLKAYVREEISRIADNSDGSPVDIPTAQLVNLEQTPLESAKPGYALNMKTHLNEEINISTSLDKIDRFESCSTMAKTTEKPVVYVETDIRNCIIPIPHASASSNEENFSKLNITSAEAQQTEDLESSVVTAGVSYQDLLSIPGQESTGESDKTASTVIHKPSLKSISKGKAMQVAVKKPDSLSETTTSEEEEGPIDAPKCRPVSRLKLGRNDSITKATSLPGEEAASQQHLIDTPQESGYSGDSEDDQVSENYL